MKKLFLVLLLGLGLLACGQTTNIPATVTSVPPTETPALPIKTPVPSPTATRLPTFTPTPYLQAAAFGDPILAAIQSVQPIYQDDFSTDRGWFGSIGDENDSASMISVSGGVLQAVGDGPHTFTHMFLASLGSLQDYVVMVDATILDDGHATRDRAIGLCWWPGDEYGEAFTLKEGGQFEGFTCQSANGNCPTYLRGHVDFISSGAPVHLTLVHNQAESAVYVDGVPILYHLLSYGEQRSGFSLCPQTWDGLPSAIVYDNLRVWNLETLSIP